MQHLTGKHAVIHGDELHTSFCGGSLFYMAHAATFPRPECSGET